MNSSRHFVILSCFILLSFFIFSRAHDVTGEPVDPEDPVPVKTAEPSPFPTCNVCEKSQCQGTNLHLCDQPCPAPWPPVLKAWGAFKNCFVCVIGAGSNGGDICGEDMDPTPGDDESDCSHEGESYCANGPKLATPSIVFGAGGFWHVIASVSNSGKWICNNNLEWQYIPCGSGLACFMGQHGATCT